ncbi:MAG: MFS transporter [Rhizomicrobium sp.]
MSVGCRTFASPLAVQRVGILVGVLIAAVGGMIGEKTGHGSGFARFSGTMIAVAIMTPLSIFTSLGLLSEPKIRTGETSVTKLAGLLKTLQQLFRNAAFVRLGAVMLLYVYANAVWDALLVFFVVDVLKLSGSVSLSVIVSLLVSVLGLLFFTTLSHKLSKQYVMIGGVTGAVIVVLSAYFLPIGNANALFIYMAFFAFFNSAGGLMMDSMTADVVDVDEIQNGEHRAGLVVSMIQLCDMLPRALGTGIIYSS